MRQMKKIRGRTRELRSFLSNFEWLCNTHILISDSSYTSIKLQVKFSF